jgi:hypothetical protein
MKSEDGRQCSRRARSVQNGHGRADNSKSGKGTYREATLDAADARSLAARVRGGESRCDPPWPGGVVSFCRRPESYMTNVAVREQDMPKKVPQEPAIRSVRRHSRSTFTVLSICQILSTVNVERGSYVAVEMYRGWCKYILR